MEDENKQRYDVIERQINKEDSLINYRLTWTLTINGFLFAALGFFGSKGSSEDGIVEYFHYALPAAGVVISFAGLLGIVAAFIQINYLTKLWSDLNDDRWPRPFGDKKHSFILGKVPSFLPPVVLVFVWVGLYCVWK